MKKLLLLLVLVASTIGAVPPPYSGDDSYIFPPCSKHEDIPPASKLSYDLPPCGIEIPPAS